MYEIELFLQTTKDLLDNERHNKWARKVQNPRKHQLNEVSIIVSNTNDELPGTKSAQAVGISRGWALPLGSRVGVPAGTGTGQGPDTRALAKGLIFSQNG